MRRPWKLFGAIVFLLAVLIGTVFGPRLLAVNDETRQEVDLYTELLTAAKANYGIEVSHEELVFASLAGLLRTLDPHTYFLPPKAYDTMREKQQSTYQGLGLFVGTRNRRLTVVTPIEGTPASRLGIRAGDIIDTINGESTESMSLDQAVGKLKGPEGTTVDITILRRGLDGPLPLTVTRAKIPQATVRYAYMLDDETGYIWLTDFARSTGEEVRSEIQKLRDAGMTRLLFDLRNNGGGLLDQAIAVSEQFLEPSSLIVETRGRTPDSFERYEASKTAAPTLDLPIVVLVNDGTASAAEIVAGAIQDHDRGLIAGTATWGKGLVQTVYNVSYGAGLGLTTAKYYTPTGRLIQRDYSSFYEYYTNFTPKDDEAEEGKEIADPVPSGPVFYTDLGRKVYGGGGITPDFDLEPNFIAPVVQILLSRNAFLDFAIDRNNRAKPESSQWRADEVVLEEFRQLVLQEDLIPIGDLEEAYGDADLKAQIARQIASEVLNDAFGPNEAHRARAEGDAQIREALGLFERATQLYVRRQNVDEGTLVANYPNQP